MHRYEKYKLYREEKIALTKSLSKHMSELGNLMTTLRTILPKNTVRIKKAREHLLAKKAEGVILQQTEAPVTQRREMPKSAVISPARKELTELEKLEMELSEIESKLSVLNK